MEAGTGTYVKSSHAWWLDSHTTSKRSPWLITTLAELEEKTKEMMKLIEEDADSFAKRAEMYYKKRPELVSLIEDFYRAYRSLAERYDQLRVEGGLRRNTSLDSSLRNIICLPEARNAVDKSSESSFDYSLRNIVRLSKARNAVDKYSESSFDFSDSSLDSSLRNIICLPEARNAVDISSESSFDYSLRNIIRLSEARNAVDKSSESSFDFCDYSEESEVDDPEPELLNKKRGDIDEDKLTSEVERLNTENAALRAELLAKDEEKREVIRQLSMSVDFLKEENRCLWRCIQVQDSKKWGSLEFKKLKKVIVSGKQFIMGLSKSQTTVVAL